MIMCPICGYNNPKCPHIMKVLFKALADTFYQCSALQPA